MTRLDYSELIDIAYNSDDMSLVLTPEQQSLAVQAVSVFRELYNWSDGDDFSDDIQALVSGTIYALTQVSTPPRENMSSNVLLLPDMASVTSGATPAWVVNTSASLGGYWQASPALTGDTLFWQVFLDRGKYNLDMTYNRTTANGKVNFNIYDPDNVLLSALAIDMRGAAQLNTVSGGSFDSPTPGRIKIEMQGNGTSGATFFRPFQRVWVNKYAEL